MTQEEMYMIIGVKEVEIYELRKQIGVLQNELHSYSVAQQQIDIRVVGGREASNSMADSKQKARATEREIASIFRPTTETETIRERYEPETADSTTGSSS